jgi:hypothetical protein
MNWLQGITWWQWLLVFLALGVHLPDHVVTGGLVLEGQQPMKTANRTKQSKMGANLCSSRHAVLAIDRLGISRYTFRPRISYGGAALE